MAALRHFALFLMAILIAMLFVPVIFLLEIQLIERFLPNLQPSLEISVGDALTIASIFGAIGVFVLEKYQTEMRANLDKSKSGALRLMLKHMREQDEPKNFEEHWRIFLNDKEGRRVYCGGDFDELPLDEFTADIYALRLEGQIDITYGGQIVPRLPFDVKARKLGHEEKKQLIEKLTAIADRNEDEYERADAIRILSKIKDPSIVPIVQGYLNDPNTKIRLEAAKSLTELVAFPED